MNLESYPHKTLRHANEHVLWVLRKVCPDLLDVKIWYDDETTRYVLDMDFLMKGQEEKLVRGDEWDGLEEYIPGSKTYESLVTVALILSRCFDLKCAGE